MTACFLSNVSAKYYKNPSMLSRVIAKNIGDVFLRHSVFRAQSTCLVATILFFCRTKMSIWAKKTIVLSASIYFFSKCAGI